MTQNSAFFSKSFYGNPFIVSILAKLILGVFSILLIALLSGISFALFGIRDDYLLGVLSDILTKLVFLGIISIPVSFGVVLYNRCVK